MAGRGAPLPQRRGHVHSPCCCCCCCCCVGRNGGRGGGMQPSAVFLLGTLALTSAATALLAASIMTDRWEEIKFDPEAVKAVAKRHNNASRLNGLGGGDAVTGDGTTTTSTLQSSSSSLPPLAPGAVHHTLLWLFGGAAVRVTIARGPPVIPGMITPAAMPLLRSPPSASVVSRPPPVVQKVVTSSPSEAMTEVGWLSDGPLEIDDLTSPVSVTSEWTALLEGAAATRVKRKTHGSYVHRSRRDAVTYIFLVPMHGGIWTLCVSLSEEERNKLREIGFTEPHCTNYLSPEAGRTEEARTDWQHRMQNLSISCALVCLIILGSSALVGAFGVLQHQISAVLVTGVMYLLAATFATFTLTIMHFKRRSKKVECVVPIVDGVPEGGAGSTSGASDTAPSEYAAARIFSSGWSLDLGWMGVVLCVLASALWILLSKIMRYSPLSFPTS